MLPQAVRRLAFATLLATAGEAAAFCGFYVGKADSSLWNEASQVILVRDGEKTVISMLNDYKGELTDFALVVPVPQVLKREQINVGERKMFDRLDAYSTPRLAEYYDSDPCARREMRAMAPASAPPAQAAGGAAQRNRALGVTVEAQYTVGEYDISILSAKESDGLETWLVENGYRIPAGASRALAPYVRQAMKFFVARVNLKEQAKTGFTTLRPLQFAFDSEKFMLPIRLGMVNANGPQDLIAYVLTKNGRVETTNYRTVKLPANMDLPVFVRGEFRKFYRALFDEQAKREGYRVVFTEYFWDMSWCDPCAADPLSAEELRAAGVFWIPPAAQSSGGPPPAGVAPGAVRPMPRPTGAQQVMLTRLHVRYTPETFPEDLVFQETKDRQNYQTRYVLRHPWQGEPSACAEARSYLDGLDARLEREAQQLATLTGWGIDDIRNRIPFRARIGREPRAENGSWWERLWK